MENCYPADFLNKTFTVLRGEVNKIVIANLVGTDDRSKMIVEKGNKVLSIISTLLQMTS